MDTMNEASPIQNNINAQTTPNELPQPVLTDISDQSTKEPSLETSEEPSEEPSVEPSESYSENDSLETTIPTESESIPPFLQPENLIIKEQKLPDTLNKAIHFRNTLKNKHRGEYDNLSKSEKSDTKKKIIHHLIHVLRTSTQKNTFDSHKKLISNLRRSFNKHLDYIEKNNRSIKKNKK